MSPVKQASEKTETRAAVTPSGVGGICTTCNFAAECVNARRGGSPIWFCEQFDGVADVVPSVVAAPRIIAALDEAVGVGGKGLCVNCGNSAGCNLSRPEAGVWHCEEFSQ